MPKHSMPWKEPDAVRLPRILDALEEHHGRARSERLTPYELLLFANAGYPASDARCSDGYEALSSGIGTDPRAILGASKDDLREALRRGGSMADLRADRVRAIARCKLDPETDPDAIGHLPLATARKLLKSFPTIGDPGADKILLLSHTEPVAAVPSNATQVPLRLGFGKEQKSYAASYRSAQARLDALLPRTFPARVRAYALLRRHGEQICKRSKPACDVCAVAAQCPFAHG